MTAKEIRGERKRIEKEIDQLETQIEILRIQLNGLEKQCEHKKKYQYSACGELGWYCPDCGYQT